LHLLGLLLSFVLQPEDAMIISSPPRNGLEVPYFLTNICSPDLHSHLPLTISWKDLECIIFFKADSDVLSHIAIDSEARPVRFDESFGNGINVWNEVAEWKVAAMAYVLFESCPQGMAIC
jgi:hypothetical protein